MFEISIVLPVYNAKSFVDATIDSVLGQTFRNWELIIVDDCSTDGTYEYLCAKYSDNANIKVFKNDINSGAGKTRNKGLQEASADIIAFLDADDVWMPRKLELQLAHMHLNNSAIVHTSYAFIDENGNSIAGKVIASSKVTLNSYMRNTEIGMSTSLLNRKLIGDFRLDTMRTRQDTKLWLTLLDKGFTSEGIEDILVLYRIRSGQISGNKFKIAWRTLKLYWTVDSLPSYARLVNFFYYASNGVLKRLKK
jgi:teichuronic acid biosynthesis glycosyltransferase TuaG